MRNTEREKLVVSLREKGKLKFREIGERIGVGPGRARYLYLIAKKNAKRKPHWTDSLSFRARQAVCSYFRYNSDKKDYDKLTKDEVIKAIKSGRISMKNARVGLRTMNELLYFAGMPILKKKSRIPKICPHCGKGLYKEK